MFISDSTSSRWQPILVISAFEYAELKVIVGGAHFELQKSPKRKAVPIDSQQEDSLNVDLTLYSHNSEYNENIKQKSLPVAIESIFRQLGYPLDTRKVDSEVNKYSKREIQRSFFEQKSGLVDCNVTCGWRN